MNRTRRNHGRDSISLFSGVTLGSLLGILSPNLAPFQIGALIDQLHFDERQVGVLVTAELMTVSLVALCCAPIFTRFSCSAVAIIGLAISLVGQLATIFSAGYSEMMAARSIAAIGFGMIYAAANAAGAGARDPDRIFSLSTAAALTILAVLLPTLTLVNSGYGFRGMYAAVAILSMLTLPALKGLGSGDPRQRSLATREGLPMRRVGHLLAVLAIFDLGSGAVWSSFERIGVRHGMSAATIGSLAGLSAGVGIASALSVAWVAPRFNRTTPLAIGLGVAAIACYLIPAAESTALFVTSSIFYWLSYMFIYPYLLAIAAAFDPSGRCSAAAAGTLMTSYSLGPLVASILASDASLRNLSFFGFGCCALAMVALVPLTLALDRKDQSR